MRTPEEKTAAVARLKENKSKTSQFNGFGEDKHAGIDAMIETIENDYNDDEIDNHFGFYPDDEDEQEDGDDKQYRDAMSALEWLNGEMELDELLYPE